MRLSTNENIYLLCTLHFRVTVSFLCLYLLNSSLPFKSPKSLSISNNVPELLSLLLINPAHLLPLPHFCDSLLVFHSSVHMKMWILTEISFLPAWFKWQIERVYKNLVCVNQESRSLILQCTETTLHCISLYAAGLRFQFPNRAPAMAVDVCKNISKRGCVALKHTIKSKGYCTYWCRDLYFGLMCLRLPTTHV